jgi:hypothetical protein
MRDRSFPQVLFAVAFAMATRIAVYTSLKFPFPMAIPPIVRAMPKSVLSIKKASR